MRRILPKILLIMLCCMCVSAGAFAREDVDALRSAYMAAVEAPGEIYIQRPVVAGNFSAGRLSDEAQTQALAYANFIRSLAGLEAVSLNAVYTMYAQHGAMLLAANGAVAHDAPKPSGMPDDMYLTAHTGTMGSNLAGLNWQEPNILLTAVKYFLQDEGEQNAAVLGHRRWLLNPCMAQTGFGLAADEEGSSYILMYAVDTGAEPAWQNVCWPCSGLFPCQLMDADTAWSVTLNPEFYDLAAGAPSVTLTLENGPSWFFDFSGENADGFCRISTESYGAGPCLIFTPNLAAKGVLSYEQNQIWTVDIAGLKNFAGEDMSFSFRAEMFSIYPVDVASVQADEDEISLPVGDTYPLSARAIPQYADNTALLWTSSDSSIASVDANGLLTAVSEGECVIRAESINGKACEISVAVIP